MTECLGLEVPVLVRVVAVGAFVVGAIELVSRHAESEKPPIQKFHKPPRRDERPHCEQLGILGA